MNLNYLGHGMEGVVYGYEDLSKVVKYTLSEQEALDVKVILDLQKEHGVKNLPGVVAVESITKTQESPSVFTVFMERVTPLSKESTLSLDNILMSYYDIGLDPKDPSELMGYDNFLDSTDYIEEEDSEKLYNDYVGLIGNLTDLGLNPYDTKPENLGRRGEELVLLDIGGLTY